MADANPALGACQYSGRQGVCDLCGRVVTLSSNESGLILTHTP